MSPTHNEIAPSFMNIDGAEIAVRYREGTNSPGLVWLGGYRSDMLGTKAIAVDQWATENNHPALRFDYSGHGESGGDFNDGCISRWLNESLEVYNKYTAQSAAANKQILIGSSMGGWIALRMAQELKKLGRSPAGIILIAPAPDFTKELIEPRLSDKDKESLHAKGYFEEPSEYSPNPYIYTRKLIEDGRNNLVLKGIIETDCPVHILQGMKDEAVPYAHAMKLMEHLPSTDVTMTLINDGDHRLSREQDIDLLLRSIAIMSGSITTDTNS